MSRKINSIPAKNRFRMNHGTDEKPILGVMVYCFDDAGKEIGMYNPITSNGEIDISTAGREWDESFKNKLI